jgi:hypothetical protein
MAIEYLVLEMLFLPSMSTCVDRGGNVSSALQFETVGYHRTLVTFYHNTQCVIPKDSIPHKRATSIFCSLGRRK